MVRNQVINSGAEAEAEALDGTPFHHIHLLVSFWEDPVEGTRKQIGHEILTLKSSKLVLFCANHDDISERVIRSERKQSGEG